MDFSALKLTVSSDAVRFEVHAKPRARKSAIVGTHGDALDVAIGAPPVEGAANEELVRFLAKTLGVAKSAVAVVRGESSRVKLVEVHGVAEAELRSRLAAKG
jgi:uncharacterized protein (TIGR00251 family)